MCKTVVVREKVEKKIITQKIIFRNVTAMIVNKYLQQLFVQYITMSGFRERKIMKKCTLGEMALSKQQPSSDESLKLAKQQTTASRLSTAFRGHLPDLRLCHYSNFWKIRCCEIRKKEDSASIWSCESAEADLYAEVANSAR